MIDRHARSAAPVVDRRARGGSRAAVLAVLLGVLAVALLGVTRAVSLDDLGASLLALLRSGDAPGPVALQVEQPGSQVTAPPSAADRLHALIRAGDIDAAAMLAAQLDDRALNRVVDGMTAVMLAASHGDAVLVATLVEHGADPNRRGSSERTALQYAAETNRIAAVRVLLDAGADIDGVDDTRLSPLVMAAERGYTDLGLLLIERGADVDIAHVQGWTALIDAARSGNAVLVERLLEAGARVDGPQVNGWDALGFARKEGHDEIVRLLEQARR